MEMNKRLKKLRQSMESENLPALLVGSAANRYYLSGFTGSAGSILLTPRETYLVTDFRYVEQAAQQSPHLKVIRHGLGKYNTIKELLAKEDIKEIGFEAAYVTFDEVENHLKAGVPDVDWLPTKGLVENLRLYKSPAEVEKIYDAVKLTDEAFEHICDYIKAGQKERDVALELEIFFRKNGATGPSFDLIVASGARSALPHGVAGDKVIEEGDLIVIDMGAILEGYVSDFTRTVIIGKPGKKEKEIYNIVLQAQLAAIAGIKPGMTGREADAIARRVIEEAGYGEYFGHGLGHGLGIVVHEMPGVGPSGEMVLEPGMMITIEPGIYLPGWGGVRIEDVGLVEEEGLKILTAADKDFISL